MRAISEIIVAGRNLADILRNDDLSCADLSCADLRNADLSGANLSGANLSGADLSYANLSCTNLSGADLSCTNLSGANLSGANLSGADLSCADLSYANLSGANLSGANLSGADLSYANLSGANLINADLSGANLSGADLSCTNLSGADLSGAENLLNPVKWLAENFEDDDLGYIVYKAIGNTDYAAPAQWKIDAGEIIEEVVNPLPTNDCGCGVNFGTLQWVKEYCREGESAVIWRCRIRWIDLPGVVVPYNTTGKARCNRLELLETIG